MPRYAPYGFARQFLSLTVPQAPLASTSAVAVTTALPIGHKCRVEKVSYVATVAHAGSGGTRTINVKKGSTVIATAALPLASVNTAGAIVDIPVTAANADLDDADTLTVDFSAGGTVFTTAGGDLIIRTRARLQKEA